MKTTRRIENLQHLQDEIALLKLKKAEQELYFIEKKDSLKESLKSPFTFMKKAMGILKGNENIHADWTTALARISIPFLLNKTLLRGKGAILKSLITLLSQRVINPAIVNQNKVFGAVEKISGLVGRILNKKVKSRKQDYGIPPDSETY